MAKIKLYIFFVLVSTLLAFNSNDYNIPTGEDYITGEDGIKRIYINIWGHVKYPGTYLVYEDIDITTLLSMAGGPLDGADLSNIKVMRKNNTSDNIDLENILSSNKDINFEFSPYDTISVKPTFSFYIRDNAYILNVFLQLLTLGITVNIN
tara:strand:+ start:306 stop:758 length:453 start_codon:yes stop_codon:yes gene_type:complete